jgi:NAD(P)-dependent dehydrogenase (short-subunit alcohol dehydrogenase family)
VRAAFEATSDQFGGLDVLVDNAGIITESRVEDMPVSLLDRMLAVTPRRHVTAPGPCASRCGKPASARRNNPTTLELGSS